MTSHELARVLLAQPDLPAGYDVQWGQCEWQWQEVGHAEAATEDGKPVVHLGML